MTNAGRLEIHLHFCLSFTSHASSGSEYPNQSVMSSDHVLGGLPRGRPASTIPTSVSSPVAELPFCRCFSTVSTSSAFIHQVHYGALSFLLFLSHFRW